METKYVAVLVLPLLFCSCFLRNQVGEDNEVVMSPGMIIEARNSSGKIAIEAGEGLQRMYRWDTDRIEVKMWNRDSRWDGSLGLYNPGGGRIHTVVQEGQQHFNSEREALEWLVWQDWQMHYVYSADGLVVGWYSVKSEESDSSVIAISVQVWQFYINGRKPKNLPGAAKTELSISFRDGFSPQEIRVGKFRPNSPRTINGRMYSGRTIDIMEETGITADIVEKCIRMGEPSVKGDQITYNYYDKTRSDFMWAATDRDGRVVLIAR
jgi:hypothetical protein